MVSLGVIGLGALIWWLGSREGALWLESRALAREMARVPGMVVRQAHTKDCRTGEEERLFEEDEVSDLLGYRLRFINAREYVVEAVCRSVIRGPFEISRGELGREVVKSAGSGLMVYVADDQPLEATVLIELKGKQMEVGFAGGELVRRVVPGIAQAAVARNSADTTCEGWGYRCCSMSSQVGEGELQPGVIDCPASCYQICLDRPVVTLFNTEPLMDTNTRTLHLASDESEVQFGYRIQPMGEGLNWARLDAGDGMVYPLDSESGVVLHRYGCGLPRCEYVARLEAENTLGIGLGDSRVREVRVVISD